MNASLDELTNIKDIGPVLAKSIYDYFRDDKNIKEIKELLKHINITKNKKNDEKLKDMIFVITGSLIISLLSFDNILALPYEYL